MLTAPRIQQSIMDPKFVSDPYPIYARARALGDFVFWEDYDMVMATSYGAVKAVVTHTALGLEAPFAKRASRPAHLAAYHRIDDHSLLRLEDQDHLRVRQAAKEAIGDEVVLSMAPTISRVCDELIDRFPQNAPFDLQASFADKLPMAIVMHLLGLPREAEEKIKAWCVAISKLKHAPPERHDEDAAEAATLAMSEFMREQIAAKWGAGNEGDFIGRLMNRYETLAEEEIIALVLLMVQAAAEAGAYSLGAAVPLLVNQPDRKLALAPDQIGATVDECLRFEPSIHVISRFAQEDVSILGLKIARGMEIGCLLGSACRDDAVWPDGDVFDPFRAARPHLGFAGGVHACWAVRWPI